MKPALLLYPHVSSYPVFMLLGFFFGWLLARRRASLFGIEGRHLDNICLLLPIAGIFGARLFARLFYAKLPLLEALKVWEGDGLVFYGGFLFGILTVVIYGIVRQMNLPRLMECVAPSVAVGLAFGRIGCFLAGCCWGDVCVAPHQLASVGDTTVARQVQTFPAISPPGMPLAVQFPEKSDAFKQHRKIGLVDTGAPDSLPVHPVQLYEAALAFALAFLLHRSGIPRVTGNISLGLLIGYAVIRFFTEYLRADNKQYLLTFTFSQVVSLWIALFCAVAVLVRYWLLKRESALRESSQVSSTIPLQHH